MGASVQLPCLLFAWTEAQAVFFEAMRDVANRVAKPLTSGGSHRIRIAGDGPPEGHPTAMASLASITIACNWVVNGDRSKSLAPNVDFQLP